jgi:hypothetical protein
MKSSSARSASSGVTAQSKSRRLPGWFGKARLDQADDLLRDGVGHKADGLGHESWSLLAEGVAVLGVEVPRAADGLLAVHQDARALAHLAVEKLQAQLLARGGVLAELVERDEEVAVGAHLQRHAELLCGLQQAL